MDRCCLWIKKYQINFIPYLTQADILLIHWPCIGMEKAWEEIQKFKEKGCVRIAGVSNFRIAHLEILKHAGGTDAFEPIAIGYAESEDGITWEKFADNPVLEPDKNNRWEQHKVCACHVLKHDGWYYMFYIGHMHEERAQVGMARSRDGITGWEKHPQNPIIAPDAGTWDGLSVYKPYVLWDGEKWVMWYNGARYDENIWCVEQIGVAYLRQKDFGFDK